MVSLINKQLLLTAYAYLFIMEQQKAQQGGEALQLQMNTTQQEAEEKMAEQQQKPELPDNMKAADATNFAEWWMKVKGFGFGNNAPSQEQLKSLWISASRDQTWNFRGSDQRHLWAKDMLEFQHFSTVEAKAATKAEAGAPAKTKAAQKAGSNLKQKLGRLQAKLENSEKAARGKKTGDEQGNELAQKIMAVQNDINAPTERAAEQEEMIKNLMRGLNKDFSHSGKDEVKYYTVDGKQYSAVGRTNIATLWDLQKQLLEQMQQRLQQIEEDDPVTSGELDKLPDKIATLRRELYGAFRQMFDEAWSQTDREAKLEELTRKNLGFENLIATWVLREKFSAASRLDQIHREQELTILKKAAEASRHKFPWHKELLEEWEKEAADREARQLREQAAVNRLQTTASFHNDGTPCWFVGSGRGTCCAGCGRWEFGDDDWNKAQPGDLPFNKVYLGMLQDVAPKF